MKPEDWPRLSTAPMKGGHTPCVCAECAERDMSRLTLWQEHDEDDQPELRFVWLCRRCSDALIDRHVRLYAFVDQNAPAPGAMSICAACQHRTGTFCPMTKPAGGPGIKITATTGLVMHVDGSRNGKRWSRTLLTYHAPPSDCTERKVFEPPSQSRAEPESPQQSKP